LSRSGVKERMLSTNLLSLPNDADMPCWKQPERGSLLIYGPKSSRSSRSLGIQAFKANCSTTIEPNRTPTQRAKHGCCDKQPRLLVIWGKAWPLAFDPSERKSVAGMYQRLRFTFLDPGHFAFDTLQMRSPN
jgi:hypothetical protein